MLNFLFYFKRRKYDCEETPQSHALRLVGELKMTEFPFPVTVCHATSTRIYLRVVIQAEEPSGV